MSSRPGYPGGQPPPRQQQPPLSFRTVPGRNRTQKWNEAKTYNYDGDDWGGFDPYDEYGGPEEEDHDHAAPPASLARQQSFEVGSERRQFSGPAYPHPAERRGSPAMSATSGNVSDRDRPRLRDYSNPSSPPLQPQTIARKASAGSIDSSGPRSPDKPLPFIRPSDIYKRMAEEQEKEKERLSMESNSRPSMDSLQREGTPAGGQRPLSTVQERPGSQDISTLLAAATGHEDDRSNPVPSTDNPTFADSTAQAHDMSAAPSHPDQSIPSEREPEDLHSMVHSAFEPASQPASNEGNVTRSNTDSTSAISPIMSRMTSGAVAAHQLADRDAPVSPISEEPPNTVSHSRNVSAETMIPTRYTAMDEAVQPPPQTFARSVPSPGNSPARTPDLGHLETRRLSGPLAAELTEATPVEQAQDFPDEVQRTGRPRRGTDYSVREADLAHEVSNASESQLDQVDVGEAQRDIQTTFLSDRTTDGGPLQREWSFDTSESRSGAAEILSVGRAPGPERNDSFRPQLPGQWISAAPTPAFETGPPLSVSEQHSDRGASSGISTPSNQREPDFSPSSNAPQHRDEGAAAMALDAVKNAGAALGAAFLGTAGNNHQDHDFAAPAPSAGDESSNERHRGPSGEIYQRHPLIREISTVPSESNASLVSSDRPPTPPAKDDFATRTPANTTHAPPPAIQLSTPTRATAAEEDPSTSSVESSPSEFESDRLRRDIVRSLDMSNDTAAKSAHLTDPGSRVDEARAGPRPGLLDQRFSWEAPSEAPSTAPAIPIAVVGELPCDENRESYGRPDDGQALHVTNAPTDELRSAVVLPIEPVQQSIQSLDVPTADTDRTQLSASPASMNDSTHIPSYYAAPDELDVDAPSPVQEQVSTQPDALRSGSEPSSHGEIPDKRQSARIPPFREILAMKTPPERIQAYHDTRHTFATMDTGLQDWLSKVFAAHPEHEELKNAQPLDESVFQDARGHKYNPSLLKMVQRSSNHETGDRRFFSAGRSSDVPPALPPKDMSETGRQLQAKGKDIMKSAGVLGGKAQAGAKGLFAKGKSRFGRDR